MKKSEKQKLVPARIAMVKALRLTMNGNINLAKKELNKARKALDKQYA